MLSAVSQMQQRRPWKVSEGSPDGSLERSRTRSRAGLFGLVGTLVPAALAWTRERDVASRRLRQLDEASRRIQFWDQWLKLSTQLNDPADRSCVERVQQEISYLGRIIESDSRDVHDQISQQRDATIVFQRKVHLLPVWREWLLLYRPARPLAWLPRIFFFAGLFLALLLLLTLADPAHAFSRKDLLVVEVMLIVWMVIFRALSKGLERPPQSAVSPPVGVVSPSRNPCQQRHRPRNPCR